MNCRRGDGVSLPWVYVHSAIYETYLVVMLQSMVESVCHGYMCILLYMKLIWCSGFAWTFMVN